MRHLLIAATLMLLAVFSGNAGGARNMGFQLIGARDGLANGNFKDITFDKNGFIYVAQETGISIISGAGVPNGVKNEIPVRGLTCICYAPNTGKIWIGTKQSGVIIYDCATGKTTKLTTADGLLSDEISHIQLSASGAMWVLHIRKGLQRIGPGAGEIENFISEEFPDLVNHTRYLVENSNGNVFIAHFGHGLSVLNIHRRKIHNFNTKNSLMPSDYVRSLFFDSKGNLWIASLGGVALMDMSSQTITVLDNDRLASKNVFDINEDRNGDIWVASEGGGITIISPSLNGMTYEALTPDNSRLYSPNPHRIRQDEFGNMWIGHYPYGVNFVAATKSPFVTTLVTGADGMPQSCRSLDIGADDTLWVGSDNLLTCYRGNAVAGRWKIRDGNGNDKYTIKSLFVDSKGRVWLGFFDSGISMFDPKTERFEHINLGTPLDTHVFLENPDGSILVGTDRSVFVVCDGVPRKEESITEVLKNPVVISLLRDRKQRLWVGTLSRGMSVLDNKGRLLHRFDDSNGFPSNDVTNLYLDRRGRLWAATANGLVQFDNADPRRYKVLGQKEGLDNMHVQSVIEDNTGNIWLTTFGGLSCLNPTTGKFTNYDTNDGMPEMGFYENSIAADSAGEIYVESSDGVLKFNPLDLDHTTRLSPLRIVSAESLISDNDWKRLTVSDGDAVKVPYGGNTLRLRFSTTDFAQSKSVEYSFKMEGMSDQWQSIGAENQLMFHHLASGNYTLFIRGKLKNGEWDESSVCMLHITVSPPWWLAWYFKVFYILIILAGVFLVVRRYNRRLLQRNSYELQKKAMEIERKKHQDEQDLNQERLRFYTNIAHELRTPLTLILGPLEDLASDKELPAPFRPQIKSIHNSSTRLLNLINQIMEFRKTETQNRQLTVSKGDLSEFVTEIGLRYKELHRNENVAFNTEVKQLNMPIYFDRDIVTTIITNFLSNAIKYTARGHITLRLDACMEGDVRYAQISVEDTGYGIEENAISHICDRYYQVNGKHQASGTGIGLALVKSLAELHHGLLKVESKLGVGSTFSFLIAMSEIYPDAVHKEDTLESSSVSVSPDENGTENKPLVLIVEDNDDIRQYVKRTFDKECRVLEASNGKEGLDLALKDIPDVIISDIMMPEMDGIELCQAIKSDIRTSHIPVILLTAKDSLQDKETGYEIGADSYITKPFSGKLLRLRVHNILEGRRRLSQRLLQQQGQEIPTVLAEADEKDVTPTEEIPQLSPLDAEFLEKLDGLISANLENRKIDMEFLASSLAMSHSTFYRKVKMLTGITAVEYVRKFRLRRSVELMKTQRYNVTEIIYMTGFNTPSYFRESFKEEYGKTPSQFLADLKKQPSNNS